ncbi:protein psi1-like [Andrographis paniculata]|uniref:protein psi1-like n=1 Tax=Andrographis paniculata TaxID=175694 RepID=UPI0021E83835|nr:protein psi1-like [Andrographis paniculata]
MGDLGKSSNTKLSRQKTVYVKDICKTYKSLLQKWHSDGHPASPKDHDKFSISGPKLLSRTVSTNTNAAPITPRNNNPSRNSPAAGAGDDFTISSPTLLVRTTSQITPLPAANHLNQSKNYFNKTTPNPPPIDDGEELHISSPTLVARTTSRISGGALATGSSRKANSPTVDHDHGSAGSTTPKMASPVMTMPIFFSQSGTRRKPPPVEKKLDCSLEELCFGCVKKINITRDALSTNGLMIQEEEVLTIKVEGGWRKGTRIVFEGKGGERPGNLPADVVFEVQERPHPLYKRRGDDLELGVEVPLLDALLGCAMSVPLLGGGHTDLTLDDVIICPGYETSIAGQGMPVANQKKKRGDLRLKFDVEFPAHLTLDQRSQVASVLEQCDYN